jgi:hypothetical protein
VGEEDWENPERIYVPEEQLLKNIRGKDIISLAYKLTAMT